MNDALTVNALTKTYGDLTAVDHVSLTVEQGEIFGLLGPNGAGKTTFISMLTGIIEPTSGSARVAGHDLAGDLQGAKEVIGLVPQDLALYPTLSARQNLQFFGRIYGLRGKALEERIAEVLRIVALTERADDAVDKYSGGMKRRVNIAAGLLNSPQVLFLDEPTVGVDPQSRNYIFETVMRLNREHGMTVVYTSHYMEEVELLCHRVAIMDQGRVIALDTVRNLVGMLAGVIHLGLGEVDGELLAALGGLPAVTSAAVAPAPASNLGDGTGPLPEDAFQGGPAYTTVKIETENSQQALLNVISLLDRRDVAIRYLQVLEPNLENVFLHLTGKKLRE